MISLTLTSCKRPDLFCATIESFKENCLDNYVIKEIVWADDNSSSQDHEQMRACLNKHFPSTPIKIMHRCARAGLNNSLNEILNVCRTRFAIHLEDDWLFVKPAPLISMSIAFLFSQKNIRQIGFRDWNRLFDKKRCDRTGFSYTLWEPGVAKDGTNLTHKGFSLNPSVFDLEFYKNSYGNFNENNIEGSWDQSYADGYRTAYFTEEYVRHIGTGVSSFDLNQTFR